MFGLILIGCGYLLVCLLLGSARCVWICFLFGELVVYVLFGLLGGSG